MNSSSFYFYTWGNPGVTVFLPHNCSQNFTWVLKVAKSSIKLPIIEISTHSLRLLSFLKTIRLVRSLFTEFSTSHCLLNLADLVLRCKVDDCRVEGWGKTLKLSPESTQNTIIMKAIKMTNKPFLQGWGIYVEYVFLIVKMHAASDS